MANTHQTDVHRSATAAMIVASLSCTVAFMPLLVQLLDVRVLALLVVIYSLPWLYWLVHALSISSFMRKSANVRRSTRLCWIRAITLIGTSMCQALLSWGAVTYARFTGGAMLGSANALLCTIALALLLAIGCSI